LNSPQYRPGWLSNLNDARKIFFFSGILLSLLLLAAYYPALRGFFVSDDFNLINAVRTQGPFGLWTVHAAFFRPIVSLSVYFDHSVWGLNAVGYKLTNFVTHLLNSLLVGLSVWLLIRPLSLERQRAAGVSVFAGLIFALLPAHAEAVSWVSGRTDLICTFFGLGAWCGFLAYSQYLKARFLVVSAIAFALALMSKEAVLTLPLIMGLYVAYLVIGRRSVKPAVLACLVNGLVLLLYLPVRYVAVGGIGGYGSSVHLSIDPVRWLAGPPIFLARTFWPCCWPVSLLPGTALLSTQIEFMRWFYLGIGIVFSASTIGLALVYRQKRQPDLWGLAVFLLLAGMVAQLPSVSIGLQAETRIGERLVYLPSSFVSSLIALLVILLLTRRYQRWGAALILLLIYGISLWQTNVLWYKAGETARSVLDSMRTVDVSRPINVILPDHLQGAFVFRNGLQAAAELFAIRGEWNTLGWVTLNSPQDGFVVKLEAGEYHLTPLQPQDNFILATPPTGAMIVSSDSKSAQVTRSASTFVYYAQGGLQVAP
jgi:hypothetical protein